jgi:hypothetical protein
MKNNAQSAPKRAHKTRGRSRRHATQMRFRGTHQHAKRFSHLYLRHQRQQTPRIISGPYFPKNADTKVHAKPKVSMPKAMKVRNPPKISGKGHQTISVVFPKRSEIKNAPKPDVAKKDFTTCKSCQHQKSSLDASTRHQEIACVDCTKEEHECRRHHDKPK